MAAVLAEHTFATGSSCMCAMVQRASCPLNSGCLLLIW
jgi:hypothetical protein